MANQTEKGATSVTQTTDYNWMPFPIPGATGDLTAAVLNVDINQGPVVAILKLPANSRIPAHYHKKAPKRFS